LAVDVVPIVVVEVVVDAFVMALAVVVDGVENAVVLVYAGT
jgi:hypothetical protein